MRQDNTNEVGGGRGDQAGRNNLHRLGETVAGPVLRMEDIWRPHLRHGWQVAQAQAAPRAAGGRGNVRGQGHGHGHLLVLLEVRETLVVGGEGSLEGTSGCGPHCNINKGTMRDTDKVKRRLCAHVINRHQHLNA